MRRLAVIDVDGGSQPIFNEDGSIVVVFNGEIYNFQELRRQLLGRGHTFQTDTDTEVIAHLYEDRGEACVEDLRGMFAFAIWDARKERLMLARDRLGVKPLYYFHDSDRLLFGSEIKAILQDESVPRESNIRALDQVIALGHVIPPATVFKGIHELPQATTLIYEDGRIRCRKFWDLVFDADGPYDELTAMEELESLFREAVRIRMISDVPVGALLSGGIDSGCVVALMSELNSEPVKTFSIGFDDPAFSELASARLVAEKYGTDHHEFIVKPQVEDITRKLIRHHDTPFFDTSAIPTYHVCRLAREHVTVALSGDGGDELFGGYAMFLANKAAQFYQVLPRWLRRGVIHPLARRFPESSGYVNKGRVVREFALGGDLSLEDRYLRWTAAVKEETRRRLYEHSVLRDALANGSHDHVTELFAQQPQQSDLNRMLYVWMNTMLPHDMLIKVDRMSMASSLEVRSPLLDHHLFEFAARLPDTAKVKGWTTKYLMRKLGNNLLPKELTRLPKRGFSIPLDRWLRHELKDFVQEILFDEPTQSRGYFDQQVVRDLVEKHLTGQFGYGRELWTLVTIELWHREYIDRFTREGGLGVRTTQTNGCLPDAAHLPGRFGLNE